MALETKATLSEPTIAALQALIRVNLDSEKGFREAAGHCDGNTIVVGLFEELARQRSVQAAELRRLVGINEEEPEDTGSAAGTAHRFLLNVRGKLGGGAPVMLIEAERGEDSIKSAYEETLKQHAGSAVTDVLNRHYAAVKAGHDQVRDMRDALNT